ncbi:MAG TPA: helicase-exonuclease AddAB subunit AddA, partial [Candidatus Merdenecus merdavium]|nr:helicase-exonuclease AddAB subunit AddA [Candidatus Merdenecus merdavium]
HKALEILVNSSEGEEQYSEAANQLADLFDEVLIDEYQDSNLVQETILTSVSKICQNKRNVFMVGDVKQSIYRFRLARPELFMEKYETYETNDSQCQRIDLHKNFRSRAEVLSGINFIFDQIMAKYLGNIQYNEEAALYPGASFPEGNNPDFAATEVLLIDMEDEGADEVEETAREIEARAIGHRMKEIVGKELVLDKASGEYRPARYHDMVILLRTITGWADTFTTVLGNMGIPAYSTSSTGYFSTVEVQNVLSLLQIMDNPNQEIPLAAVLRSPMVGLVGEELAKIKSDYANLTFYDACFFYAKEGKDENLRKKLKHFLDQLEGFRKKVPYTPMHELLFHVLDETGYADYLAAMPAGKKRRANIEMLVEKAIAYEATSYRGLFNFIRYIEQLQKYEVDFGEASTIGENEDAVRIMSIHKSKGLEFPIVFAAGMGKSFNTQDSKAKLSLHPELGVAMNYVDPNLRVQSPTLLKKVIQRQLALENLGEELRVLYVAFTRAKEKLILTGTVKKLGDKLKRWSVVQEQEQEKLSFHMLSSARTYWDWVLPALMRHPSFTEVYEAYEMDPHIRNKKLYTTSVPFHIQIIPLMELIEEEVVTQVEGEITKEMLMNIDAQAVFNSEAKEILHMHLQEEYPYEEDKDIVSKVTVSELKRRGQDLYEDESERLYDEPDMLPLIPEFIENRKEVADATRGTAYHRVLQLLEFGIKLNKEDVKQSIETYIEEGKISQEMANLVYIPSIVSFLNSDIALRMNQAAKTGDLYREQQFVIGIHANAVDQKWSKDETVLIQGIIDAYFYEGEDIILVDYKTDYVSFGHEEELVDKYRVQLNYYAEALEKITGKKVKEKIIYSFSLRKSLVFS